MEEPIKFELYEREIKYILISLQLFSLNLNSIWTIKKDNEQKDLDYANVFMLYQYLADKIHFCSDIRLERPKKNIVKINDFLKDRA